MQVNRHMARRLGATALALGLALTLVACGQNEDNRLAFDGFYFKARAKKADDDLSRFNATVSKASQSLAGARLAAAHEGTRYCIANSGTSRIRWQVGPETPADQLRIVDDTLTFRGTCNP